VRASWLAEAVLRVGLDRVGELGRGADHVQRVHANGHDRSAPPSTCGRGLKDAELRLELGRVPAEGVERLAHTVGVVAAAGRLRQISRRGNAVSDGRGRLAGSCGVDMVLSALLCGRGDGPASMTYSIGLIGLIA
jgi:hypothetical protein